MSSTRAATPPPQDPTAKSPAAAQPAARPLRTAGPLLVGIVVVVAAVFCYADVLVTLSKQLYTNDVHSHGLLIPWISLYLVWARRDRLVRVGFAPAYLGGSLTLLGGIGLLLAGRLVGVVGIQEISLIVTLAGLVLLMCGRRVLRLLWFPIAYLLLMLPTWDFATEQLHYPFQQLTATLGTWLLVGLGVPVYRQDVFLQLPNITLEVAKVCSGVNYLIAVIAIGIPVAYTSFPDLSRRLFLVLFATTIAVLGNPVRVAVIGFLAYHGLSENVHGPWHILQGLSVAMVGYVALFVGVWLLSKLPIGPRWTVAKPPPSDGVSEVPTVATGRAWPRGRVGAAAACVLVAAGTLDPYPGMAARPMASWNPQLPLRIGAWDGHNNRGPVPVGPRTVLHSGEISRTYVSPFGGSVQLYMGRYAHVEPTVRSFRFWGDDLAQRSRQITIDVPGLRSVGVNRASISAGSLETIVVYWYDLNGRIVAGRHSAKLYHAWQLLTVSGRPPLVVALASPPRPAGDRDLGTRELTSFAAELLAVLSSPSGGS